MIRRAELPPEYARLTLRELQILYTGPDALEVPAELKPWVECVFILDELVRIKRRIAVREREGG